MNYTAEYVMQLTGLSEEEAQKCLYWMSRYNKELVEAADDMIQRYAQGVRSTLLD